MARGVLKSINFYRQAHYFKGRSAEVLKVIILTNLDKYDNKELV